MGDGWAQAARPSFMAGGSGLGQMYKPGQSQDANKYDKSSAAAMRTGRDPNQNAASDLRAMLYKDGEKDQVFTVLDFGALMCGNRELFPCSLPDGINEIKFMSLMG